MLVGPARSGSDSRSESNQPEGSMKKRREPRWVREGHHDGELHAWWRNDLEYGVAQYRDRKYITLRADDGMPAGDTNEYLHFDTLAAAKAWCEEHGGKS